MIDVGVPLGGLPHFYIIIEARLNITCNIRNGWTTDLDKIKRSVDWQLKTLGTDYIDYGFIHCIDEPSDWEKYEKALDRDLVDMVMFSINPAYDYQQGEYANGSVDERSRLYGRCPFHVKQSDRMREIAEYFGA